jgi:hypothetical protein
VAELICVIVAELICVIVAELMSVIVAPALIFVLTFMSFLPGLPLRSRQ